MRAKHVLAIVIAAIGLTLGARGASAAVTNADYVNKVYEDLLSRPADAGAQTFVSQLDSSLMTRFQFASTILDSVEYRDDAVGSFFQTFLGRSATPTEVSALAPILPPPDGIEHAQETILGGTEYFASRGSSTNSGFLDALFSDLLGRPIDPTARAILLTQLGSGTTRTAVSASILHSTERRQRLVDGWYQEFLRRPAESTALTTFTGQLNVGTRQQDVMAEILASQEYFDAVPEPAITVVALPVLVLAVRRHSGKFVAASHDTPTLK